MKLKVIEIDIPGGTVKCHCKLEIQGVEYPAAFVLLESDIYAKAFSNGRDSWENSDLIDVAKDKLGVVVSI